MKERRKVERREKRRGDWKYVLLAVLGAIFGGPIVAFHGLHGVVTVIIVTLGLWGVWKYLKYIFKKPVVK